MLALTPPVPRRGLVLIDPSYEVKTDYERVVDTCIKLARRWPQGIIAVWYPLLGKDKDRSAWLRDRFSQKKFVDLLNIELQVEAQTNDSGMHGSGMFIINTPWQLDQQMQLSMQSLMELMGPSCEFRVNRLT